jgi:hypothetical protein
MPAAGGGRIECGDSWDGPLECAGDKFGALTRNWSCHRNSTSPLQAGIKGGANIENDRVSANAREGRQGRALRPISRCSGNWR